MKATVLETKNGFAAVLQEDGSVVKLRNKNLGIGDVINMNEVKMRKTRRFSTMVAAAAMLFMLIGGGGYAYATPAYYVSLDVNPGITMEVNLFERVIGMEAANEDAKEVLAGLDLNNKDIEDAISVAVERVEELGYFDVEGGEILIAVASKNMDKSEMLAGKLHRAAEEGLDENGEEVNIEADAIGYQMVQAAKAIEGMTPGKYNILVNLLGIDPANAKDYVGTSIKDIMAEFTALKAAEGKAKAEEAQDNAAEQAGSKAGNAVVETPADPPVVPDLDDPGNAPEELDVPVTPEIPVTPDVPEGSRP
jgi:hypothetical protein